jgi:hypothetical protein
MLIIEIQVTHVADVSVLSAERVAFERGETA